MIYNYMISNKLEVQGSIDIISGSQGTLTQDLTGTYDINDIKTLLGDYIQIDNDCSADYGEVGLRNGFTHPVYLDVTSIVIKKATVDFDVTKFNNLLKLLGFSNGNTIYTTDQTYTEFIYDGGPLGFVFSPYLGGKIPMLFSIPNTSIKGGFSTYTPISIKRGGIDNVSNNKIFSNIYRIRRGWEMIFNGTSNFISLIDTLKNVFKSPNYFYLPTSNALNYNGKLYLLPHKTHEERVIYSDIGLNEIVISFLKEIQL